MPCLAAWKRHDRNSVHGRLTDRRRRARRRPNTLRPTRVSALRPVTCGIRRRGRTTDWPLLHLLTSAKATDPLTKIMKSDQSSPSRGIILGIVISAALWLVLAAIIPSSRRTLSAQASAHTTLRVALLRMEHVFER